MIFVIISSFIFDSCLNSYLLANGFYIGISVILVHIVNRGSVNITTTHHILYMKYRSNKRKEGTYSLTHIIV